MNKETLEQKLKMVEEVIMNTTSEKFHDVAYEVMLQYVLQTDLKTATTSDLTNTEEMSSEKDATLPEIVRGVSFSNGQERAAAIVGYYEMVKGESEVPRHKIKRAWRGAKMKGKYADVYLQRAIRDGYIRKVEDNMYDLSQTGEEFFDSILKKAEEK